jgi:hypothetical protein
MGNELKIRRVVTGHNARGRAVVLKDGVIDGREVLGGQASFALIWKTSQARLTTTTTRIAQLSLSD